MTKTKINSEISPLKQVKQFHTLTRNNNFSFLQGALPVGPNLDYYHHKASGNRKQGMKRNNLSALHVHFEIITLFNLYTFFFKGPL